VSGNHAPACFRVAPIRGERSLLFNGNQSTAREITAPDP